MNSRSDFLLNLIEELQHKRDIAIRFFSAANEQIEVAFNVGKKEVLVIGVGTEEVINERVNIGRREDSLREIVLVGVGVVDVALSANLGDGCVAHAQ